MDKSIFSATQFRSSVSLRIAAILIGLFLFAQTAALIHSKIHPFHEHTAQCDVYAGVEHQAADAPTVITVPFEAATVVLFHAPKVLFHFSTSFDAFLARGPPASL
ncbi:MULTISPECIES: DUF2607 family protein [Thiomicrorhabdus]|uniref:DUF2607 family protein n=1 Tax=Thiomicrorhabdus heinhorstiae TaxID=2748010 RepID=A0ABS0C1A6_9GAMM|nr:MULTISPECIES: DUF2607 family protein [Thiomicrorhabdus]MBF6058112.1 DUF2607 family protein [Thiomicrorhabdus heinhorstiae]